MTRTRCGLLATTLGYLAMSGTAWAHAHLNGSTPAAGSHLTVAPGELTLRFTEAVEPVFSSVVLKDPSGATIQLDAPRPVAIGGKGNAKTLLIHLPKLTPGTYTVEWNATSVDTHQTDGRFQFTIAP